MGVTVNGEREILGIWAGDGAEGARFWLQVFSELKNRGVDDVLIAVCDGLKGLPEAINTTWERTVVQQCIVHFIRNSFRYAGRQHRDGIVKALKPVYTASSEQAAKDRFAEFTAEWGDRYPAIIKLWESAWAEFVPIPGVRGGDPTGDLHDQCDRVDQCPLPAGRQSARALPERGRSAEVSLSGDPVS
ncbi:transposase-like protein [Arthrobacter sp. CAN_A2]